MAAFLAWLRQHDLALASCRQGDVETWLATSPAAYDIRDFLAWAADRKHSRKLGWTPTGFVDTIRSGTMVYEERTGSGTGSQEVHPGI